MANNIGSKLGVLMGVALYLGGINGVVAQSTPAIHEILSATQKGGPEQHSFGWLSDSTWLVALQTEFPPKENYLWAVRDNNHEIMPTLAMLLESDIQWILEPDTSAWDIVCVSRHQSQHYTITLSPEKSTITISIALGSSDYVFPMIFDSQQLDKLNDIYLRRDGYSPQWGKNITDLIVALLSNIRNYTPPLK